MNVIFRKAEAEDLDVLVVMRLEMRRERETDVLAMSEEAFAERVRAFFAQALRDGSFVSYLAFVDGCAAACSGISWQALPPSYGNPSGLRGYVTNMYTRKAWRGMGLATRLLDCLMAEAWDRGCARVYLNASDAGRPVYEKYGFRAVGGEMSMAVSPAD